MMKDKISLVPKSPGVYIFKGQKDKILYVGKAKNLRNRLKTYFQKHDGLDIRKSAMVRLITDFSYIITKNELEALVLEATLIKQHKPRFNVVLRDDKSYPYLKLTVNEEWPRLEVTRRIERDGSLYFGPYVPAQSMWDALSFLRKNFRIRPCRYNLNNIDRTCIQYQMGRCDGPCAGLISSEEYKKIIDGVRLFLTGKKGDLISKLEKEMISFSDRLDFEEAAKIRDRIEALKHVWESQRVISPELGDIDAIGLSSDRSDVVFDVFFIRNGILIGTKDFYIRDAGGLASGEVVHSFIEMFYSKEIIPPSEIVTRVRPDDAGNLMAWLKTKKGSFVEIKTPKRGKRLEILKMADENAAQILSDRKASGHTEVLRQVKEKLRLPYTPRSIGAFDVSTTSGTESVGAFIYWNDGIFVTDMYRHLRIKEVSGVDDYAMMDEIIRRTLENIGDMVPDLILIDGGKGQLDKAKGALEASNIIRSDNKQPMLVAIAKDPDRAFLPTSEIVGLEDRSPAALFLKKIRDEVHRFALRYHRKIRDKKFLESPLMKIHGIGEKRRLELLRNFGSIEAIRTASAEDIAGLKGFNKKIAANIVNALRREDNV